MALLVIEVLAGMALHQVVPLPLSPVFAHAAGEVVEAFQVTEVDVLTACGRRVARQRRRGSRGRGGRG